MTQFKPGDLVVQCRVEACALWANEGFLEMIAYVYPGDLFIITGEHIKYIKSGTIVMWRVFSPCGLGWVSGGSLALEQRLPEV